MKKQMTGGIFVNQEKCAKNTKKTFVFEKAQPKRTPPGTNQKLVTTKARLRKVPLNVPYVSIDGVSFHSKENVPKWKCVVLCRLADEHNVTDQHHSQLVIMDLIHQYGLSKIVFQVGAFYPCLICELIVNLSFTFDDASSPDYRKVNVWGVFFFMFPII